MTAEQSSAAEELEILHRDLATHGFTPGWQRPGGPSLWNSPKANFDVVSWSYAAAREHLLRAGPLVSLELSERRNLILANPIDGNLYPTSRTQVLAYQMVLPGDRARVHRHSPHAGRLILDVDDGAYTVVNGVQVPMRANDVVLTPGWTWHGHGHDGERPALWVDFLDVPLVQLLEPMFFESHPEGWPEPHTETRATPMLFPWDETRPKIDAAPNHPYYGKRVDLGEPALPTMGLSMHGILAGEPTIPFRTTANQQYVVVEGEGWSMVRGRTIEWSRGDIFVVPCWAPLQHFSAKGAILFRVSDEPLQQYCGYHRLTAVAEDQLANTEAIGPG